MGEISCPWCEAELVLGSVEQDDGQTCPECLTSWIYEDPIERELAAAA